MPQKNLYISLALLGMSVVSQTSVHAEVYQWVDKNGVTQFSSQKPADQAIKTKSLKPHVSQASDTVTTERFDAAREAADERRQAAAKAEEESEKKAQEATLKQSNCSGAKKRVATLSRPRVNTVSEDGSRTRMPEEWRQEELKKAHESVKEWCA